VRVDEEVVERVVEERDRCMWGVMKPKTRSGDIDSCYSISYIFFFS